MRCFILYHLGDTNFETNRYYENIDDQRISVQEQNRYTFDILYSSSPPTITPYQTTYKETMPTESESEDPYDSIPADELYVSVKELSSEPNYFIVHFSLN